MNMQKRLQENFHLHEYIHKNVLSTECVPTLPPPPPCFVVIPTQRLYAGLIHERKHLFMFCCKLAKVFHHANDNMTTILEQLAKKQEVTIFWWGGVFGCHHENC